MRWRSSATACSEAVSCSNASCCARSSASRACPSREVTKTLAPQKRVNKNHGKPTSAAVNSSACVSTTIDRGVEEQQPHHRRAAVEPAEEPRGEVEQEDRDEGAGDRLPCRRDGDPDPDQDGRDRCGEGELLHEEERKRHQRDLERQEPARASADPVHGGGGEPLDGAGEGEEHGECSRPTRRAETRLSDPPGNGSQRSVAPSSSGRTIVRT